MKKKFIYILLFLTYCTAGIAQNNPQFTQYVFNQFYINPAAAGQSTKANIQATMRSQYTGYLADFDQGGSNFTSVFSADMPLSKIKGGVGIYFSNNQFSKIQSKSEFQIAYSYHKKINSNVIGLGLSVGTSNLKLMGENYRPRDLEDPLIPNTTINSFSPNINAGVYLFNPSYQLGVSVKNILEPSYKINDISDVFKDKRSVYFTGKYDLGVTYTLDISPMIIIKSDFQQVSTELGLLATYNQQYWAGINYRWQDAASVLVGGNFLKNNVKVGYSIDIVNFGTIAKSNASHEIFLRYSLNALRFGKKSIIKTPRYNI
ncbi:type IX secretion system membrane protein PorP/SprF [Lacihabitans sp. LS3-19]|uniref:PorP/SprF family type IX secretion system membrane protein n=1 Tax=Lacihabitans sp. LS3-19 TaxID=2487335 RepID=UPI0020CD6958|nr:type IX secretion system membrane protein PorP/SprF [Lacihabitans sp. LS3-19]MCP9770082.1 type IX secretion system membrane protein PorP/SprF [Lacihabitans sp. LS3-19]